MKNRRMRNVECGMRNRHLRASYSISKSEIRNLKSDRRGILLLVVLSMLTLFLLIGTAFIVTSDQYRKTQRTMARLTETSNSSIDQQDLLNEVLNQLLRDTNNSNSSLRFHSLLQDMYGNDGIYGRMLDNSARADTQWAGGGTDPNGGLTGGQMIEFALVENVPALLTDQYGLPVDLSRFDRAYNGRVLTFLDGPARGQSVRITGYLYDDATNTGLLRVMTPRLADGSTLSNPGVLDGSEIAINGRPFNGTGFGFNPLAAVNNPRLNAAEVIYGGNRELALLPNAPFFNHTQVETDGVGTFGPFFHSQWATLAPELQQRLIENVGSAGYGGTDESYDAPDFQNMLLAMLQPNAVETVLPDILTPGFPNDLGNMVIPSLHRPALLNYWRGRNFQSGRGNIPLEDAPIMLRKVLLRPNWLDHQNFDGSNPDYANIPTDPANNIDRLRRMIYGPWDVDNDLDGIRDSVWVDAGLPVMENHDGRLVKPLVALMVVDMDGRLNLNSHGSEDIANAFNTSFGLNLTSIPKSNPNELDDFYSSDLLPHGIGFGPAEISLDPLMPYDNSGALNLRQQKWKWYRRFFRGVPRRARLVADRNRLDEPQEFNLASGNFFEQDRFGKFGVGLDQNRNVINNPAPGLEGQDLAMELKNPGMPKWSNDDGNGNLELDSGQFVLGGYATPPDPRGRYAVGINDFGQIIYEAFADHNLQPNRNTNALFNNVAMDRDTPYELDLSLGANRGDSLVAPDGAYTVAELERILRPYDADAGALPSRIWEMAGEFKNNVNDTTPDLDQLNLWRTTVTTDSYDVPSPSVVVPQWMVNGIGARRDYAQVMGRPPVGATFADLLEYRIRISQLQNGQPQVWYAGSDNQTINLGPENPRTNPTRKAFIERQISKLVAPDLANGLRLDINRPIGNGRDDNDNGVVDEPGEWDGTKQGQFGNNQRTEAPYWESERPELNAFTDENTGRFRDERIRYEDRDNDGDVDVDDLNLIGVQGSIDTAAELVMIHNLRRQMLARDLYILAQTLAEPIQRQRADTDADFNRRVRQQARKLAQWAINVVDFRDPDNIMTAFEYDINPFDGWGRLPSGTDPGGIDGNPSTQRDIYGDDARIDDFNNVGAAVTNNTDVGGIVWGAERPELLITETLGWHDRATENTNKEDPANDEDGDRERNDDDIGTVPLNANEDSELPDRDYDQRLRPKGAAFVELYCPWPDGRNQGGNNNNFVPAYNRDVYAPDSNGRLGVNLAAVAVDTTGTRTTNSPCWRLMMYKDGGPGKDPNSHLPDLRPELPDRSVYFAGFDPQFPQPARFTTPARAHPDETDNERYVNDGVAFYSSQAIEPVRPGGYMVVGGGDTPGTATVQLSSPTDSVAYTPQGILLDAVNNIVQVQDANRQPVEDLERLTARATDVSTRVAIIDRAGTTGEQRAFTFSEPALGYPDRVEGSVWQPAGRRGRAGSYMPVLDIPLDDQRGLFQPGGAFTQPAGNGGFLQSKKRSELNDGETRLTLPGFRQGIGFNKAPRAPGGLGRDIEQASRTIPGFKHVYLQRLANPLLPWNPEPLLPDGITTTPGYSPNLAVNPYMTVDSMGANVTVFTGLSPEERRVDTTNPRDPILRFRNVIPKDTLVSVQRGRDNDPAKPTDPSSLQRLQDRLGQRPDNDIIEIFKDSTKRPAIASNLWTPEPIGYIDGTVAGFWKNEMGQYGNGTGSTNLNFNGVPDCTLGFLNEPFHEQGPFARGSTGDDMVPDVPFSTLAWNNRPYSNAGELLQVPAYGASQLLHAYSMRDDSDGGSQPADELFRDEAYPRNFAQGGNADLEALRLLTDGSFGHLLNFFRADNRADDGSVLPVSRSRANGLYRMLDYVHVSSPYVSTETWLNPESFSDLGNARVPLTGIDDPRYLLQPPFNNISTHREPGRINLNTITSAYVWDGGVMHRQLANPADEWNQGNNNYLDSWLQNPNLAENARTNPRTFSHQGPKFLASNSENQPGIVSSRRGYGTPFDPMLSLNSEVPTFFENPFRSADAFDHVPVDEMMIDRFDVQRNGVTATVLRNDGISPRNGATPPTLAANPDRDAEFNEANRNSLFRYMPISRLSSMTTNRSNVYAVWVTVGFFEVEPAPDRDEFADDNGFGTSATPESNALYELVYPEGYQFGKEAGIDTGDIRRVREFAMIDRTVPVAFEPGHNHNVDKAIRLRRRLE